VGNGSIVPTIVVTVFVIAATGTVIGAVLYGLGAGRTTNPTLIEDEADFRKVTGKDDRDTAERRYWKSTAGAQWFQGIVTLLAAGAGIVGLIFVNSTLNATKKAAKAAQKSADVAVIAQRPYIWMANNPDTISGPHFYPLQGPLAGSGQAGWNVYFTNYGKSPALALDWHTWVRFGKGQFVASPTHQPGEKPPERIEGGPIMPTETDFGTVFSAPLSQQQFNQLLQTPNQGWGISIRVRFDYADGNGGKYHSIVCLARYYPGVTKHCPDEEIK
jgi:hypothetical protein